MKVQPPGLLHRSSDYVVLSGSPRKTVIQAPDWGEGAVTLHLYGVDGLEKLVAPSLKYLVRYPYGCVEQTLSSFVPNLLVAELVRQGLMPPLEDPVFRELDKNIQKGVERVYGYQMDNGGWGWYGPRDFDAKANPHTTGYAVGALGAMKRLGYAVDEQRLQRGVAMSRQLLQEALAGWKQPEKAAFHQGNAAFLLLSLAQAGESVKSELESAAQLAEKGGNATLISQLALAAALSKHPRLNALLDRLEALVIREGELARWSSSEDYRYTYLSGDSFTTAMALRAFCLGRPPSPLIAAGEAYLASCFTGEGWQSTWVTGQVVALLPELAKVRALRWSGGETLHVQLDGGENLNLSALKQAHSQTLKPGQRVELNAEGRGVLVYLLTSGSAKPMSSPKNFGLQLRANRSLWKLGKPGADSSRGWTKQPWTPDLKLHDEALMEVAISSNRWVNYGLVEIPVPAGFEADGELKNLVVEGEDMALNSYVLRPEVHEDRVAFLLYGLGPGHTVRVRLKLRARLEGKYLMRPVKFSLMSDESQWCTTESQNLTIEELRP